MFHLPFTFIQNVVVPYPQLSISGSKRSRMQFLWTSAEHSTLSGIAIAIIINTHIQFDSLYTCNYNVEQVTDDYGMM